MATPRSCITSGEQQSNKRKENFIATSVADNYIPLILLQIKRAIDLVKALQVLHFKNSMMHNANKMPH